MSSRHGLRGSSASVPSVSVPVLLSRLVWLSLLPLVLVVLWLAADGFLSRWRDSDRDATHLVSNIAAAIDGNLQSRLWALGVLAASPLVDDPARWPEFYREAQGYRQQFGSHVLLVGADDAIVFNTRAAYGTRLPPLPRPKGLAAVPTAFAERRPVVGDLFVGHLAGLPMVALAVPVERGDRVPHVLMSAMESGQLQARIARVSLPPGWALVLRDGTGQTIAEAGGGPAPAADDREFVVKSRLAPWSYALRIPAASHRGDLLVARGVLAAAVLGTLALGILGVRSASRRLGRAVASLADPAPQGDAAVGAVRPTGIVEIDRARRVLDAAQAERRDSETRARRILDAAGDGIYGIDREGRITLVNPAACALLGYRAEEVLGQDAHRLFHHTRPDGTPYPADQCRGLQAIREGTTVRVDDEVFWTAGGQPLPVLYTTHPVVEDGVVTGAVVGFVDLGPRRAAAEARERALAAAEELVRLRQEFMANISHEIRTPIHGILGFAGIGRRQAADPEKAAAAFDRIEAQARRLQDVMEDILDFAALDAGRLHPVRQAFSPAEVAAAAVEVQREAARGKGLELTLSLPPGLPAACLGDPERLGRVIGILLSNAVKFTDGGRIDLGLEVAAGELLLQVSDTGIGIAEADLARAFRPFEQLDGSTTRRQGGTGLGLAVAERLVHLMGGRILAHSRPGAGSCFEVRLPLLLPETAVDAGGMARAAADGPLAGFSILAAEDDELSRAILADALRAAGATVLAVDDGRQAVDRVAAGGAFDLALLDVHMPHMGGCEAARRLRELAPELPLLAMTAHALGTDREDCLAAGIADFVFKPVSPARLVAAIAAHARRRPGAATDAAG